MLVYSNYIYLAGGVVDVTSGIENKVLLLRYDLNGELDKKFGKDGVVTFGYDGKSTGVEAIAIDLKDNIYLAGYIGKNVLLLRYSSNGQLDRRFGKNGVVTFSYDGKDAGAEAMVLDSKGNIYLAGYGLGYSVGEYDYSSEVLLLKYNSEGKLDKKFGKNGVVTFGYDEYEEAKAIALDSEGNIYLAGRSGNYYVSSVGILLKYNYFTKI